MMKKMIVLMLFLPTALFAVRGRVVDSKNGFPVWGCLIRHAESGKTARTAKDGSFSLDAGEGPGTLIFSLHGYYSRRLRIPGNGVSVNVDIRKKVPLRMGRVIVSGKKEERVSVNRVTSREIRRRTTNLFSDAMKTVQLMPGVVTGNEFSSLMYVRGGSFYETASIIDDLFILNPYLFGGISSVFNPNMVDSIQFYSGGFPASYGQAMSGVLDVEIRNGSATNTAGFLDISMTTFEGLIEGPIGKDRESSYLVSLRRTYYDLVGRLFIDDTDGVTLPFFYNLHSKLHFKLGVKTFLDFGTLLTYEGMEWKFTKDQADSTPGISTNSEFHYKDYKIMQSARLKSILSDRVAFKASLGYKYTKSDYEFEDLEQPFKLDNGMHEFQSRADIDWKAGRRFNVESGAYFNSTWFDMTMTTTMKMLVDQTNSTNAVYFITNQSTRMENDAWIYFGAYVSGKYKPGDAFQVEGGGRIEYFNITEDLILSPRFSMLWKPGKKTRIKAATGVFQQYPFVVGNGIALNEDYGNQTLAAERARHYVAGFEQDIGTDMMLRIEGFYKSYDRLVTADQVYNYVNGAERRAWGFDIFFQKKIGKKIDGWITYSYIKAQDRITSRSAPLPGRPDYTVPPGTWFSPDHDKQHNLSLVLNINLGKKYVLGFTFRYASGAPYTPLDSVVAQNDGGETVYLPIWGEYNSARYPDYMRLDVKLSMPFFGIKGASSYLQINNVFNRENIIGYSYSEDYSERKKQKSLPFIPVLGVRFEF